MASPPAESQAAEQEDELDEVLVNGQKAVRKPSIIISWMRRLLGTFSYEGYVDLQGKGDPDDFLKVQGNSDCVGFGPAPGVMCEINVRWPEKKGPKGEAIPGGVSNLSPAMMLFGFEPDDLGIRYMLVDSKGIAEPALGLLVGDTLTSKEPCVNTPGVCQKIIRITAQPDGKLVEMQVDVEMNYKRAMGYKFLMHQTSNVQGGEAPGQQQ